MNHHDTDCTLNIPYPRVRADGCDRRIAGMLYEAYAGELDAISDYSYQSIVLEDKFPVAADLIECISVVEMRHFRMLGRLILLLGFNPVIKFTDGGHRSKSIQHPPSVNEAYLRNTIYGDIAGEKKAIEEYQQLVRATDDNDIKALIRRIILDEKHHVELLTGLLDC